MKRYKLEISEDQMLVLEEALEVFSRLGTKQYDILASHIEHGKYGLNWEKRLELDKKIKEIEGMADKPCYGINSPEISDKFRVSYDMIQVLRYVRSWSNAEHSPEERTSNFIKYMSLNYDEPLKTGKEPLAKCELID